MALIDDYIEALRRALPANTRRDLLENMKPELDCVISLGTVDYALYVARKRAAKGEQDWTVPRVKSGGPGWREENRYFKLPAEKTSRFALTDERRGHHDAGFNSAVQTFATQTANLQTQLTMLVEHETLRVHKQYTEHLGDMMETLLRGLRRVQKIVAEKQAA